MSRRHRSRVPIAALSCLAATLVFTPGILAATRFDADASVWDSGMTADPAAGIFPIGGSGQVNGNFVITDDPGGIEIGLRAVKRFDPLALDNVSEHYFTVPGESGETSTGAAVWNYDIHIDLRPGGVTFADYDVILTTDVFGAPTQIDLRDALVSAGVPESFADGAVLFQTSQNPIFGNPGFDAYAPGVYTFTLELIPLGAAPALSATMLVEVCDSTQSLRVVPGPAPGDNFRVYVDLETCFAAVSDFGTILGFDAGVVEIIRVGAGASVDGGAGEPNWTPGFIRLEDARVEVHLRQFAGVGVLTCPQPPGPTPCVSEVLCLEFAYLDAPCTLDVDADLDPPSDPLIFPLNQFVRFLPAAAGGPVPSTDPIVFATPVSGALTVEGHAFIRGDVTGNGIANSQDVLALAQFLFLGSTLPDCVAARDLNDDGQIDVTDLISAVQGFFNPERVLIPEPYPARGVGPSTLACALGLRCTP